MVDHAAKVRKRNVLQWHTYLPWVTNANNSFNQKRMVEQKDQRKLLEKKKKSSTGFSLSDLAI